MNAIDEAAGRGQGQRIKPTYGYYRQPNGWITLSPAADLDELRYSRKGWTSLREYGRIEMSTPYGADHPFEALFMGGGAKEMPREQVIEEAFNIRPPILPGCNQPLSQFHKRHNKNCMASTSTVSFPQLGPEDFETFPCRFFCERDPFSTEKARYQHETVAHKEAQGDIRTGETLAAALAKALTSSKAPATIAQSALVDVLGPGGLNTAQLRALRRAGLITGEGEDDGEASSS